MATKDQKATGGAPRRRGRPPGSISLTPQRRERILGLLRGGVSDKDAAEAAGVRERTLREWVGRGEGRSARSSTPKLRAFASAYHTAKAEARASAKVRVHQKHPERWLDRGGYREEEAEAPPPSPEEVLELARELLHRALHTTPGETVPPCPHPRCRCPWHRTRTPEELARTRAMASRATRRRKP